MLDRHYWNWVQQSQLVPEASLIEAWQHIANTTSPDEITDPAQLEKLMNSLAEELLRRGLLTPWQHKRLLTGKSDGFFIGKYKKLSYLGRGGMGSVFLAEHHRMRRKVAIKVLAESLVENKASLKQFHDEARALAALDHRNIVHAYAVDNDQNVHYLVMEYVQGENLEQRVQRTGPLPFGDVANYLRQAAEGLNHAHTRGIVHRDIKPSNLLVDNEGTVKLLDLGLATLQSNTTGPDANANQHVMGTADFLAPEQACDPTCKDPRADLYSLGCTMYFLLTGQPPFASPTLMEVILKHQTQPPPNIAAIRPDVPQPLVQICERLMAKKPEDRYDSGAQVAQALAAYLGAEPTAEFAQDVTEYAISQRMATDFPVLESSSPWNSSSPSTAPSFSPPQDNRQKLLVPMLSLSIAGVLLIVGLALALPGSGPEQPAPELATLEARTNRPQHSFVQPDVKWNGSKQSPAPDKKAPPSNAGVAVAPAPWHNEPAVPDKTNPENVFQQENTARSIVVIEAEHFTRSAISGQHHWEQVSNGKFSNQVAMKCLPDQGVVLAPAQLASAPRLGFDIEFVKTGPHYLWIRAAGPDGTGDSCWLGFDHKLIAAPDSVTGFRRDPTWANTAGRQPLMFTVPTPGRHVLTVWMREDGLALDRLLITTDAAFKPNHVGPPESKKVANPQSAPKP